MNKIIIMLLGVVMVLGLSGCGEVQKNEVDDVVDKTVKTEGLVADNKGVSDKKDDAIRDDSSFVKIASDGRSLAYSYKNIEHKIILKKCDCKTHKYDDGQLCIGYDKFAVTEYDGEKELLKKDIVDYGKYFIVSQSPHCDFGTVMKNIVNKESEEYLPIGLDFFVDSAITQGESYDDLVTKEDAKKCGKLKSGVSYCKYNTMLQLANIENEVLSIFKWKLKDNQFSKMTYGELGEAEYIQPVSFFASTEEFEKVGIKLDDYTVDLSKQEWIKFETVEEKNRSNN